MVQAGDHCCDVAFWWREGAKRFGKLWKKATLEQQLTSNVTSIASVASVWGAEISSPLFRALVSATGK